MEAMARASNPVLFGRSSTEKAARDGVEEDRWRSIFAELADGRLRALDELYNLAATDAYRLALWRTGSVEDAEDVVQDVFVKVAEQGPRLARVRRPKRWLLTVAHRCAVDCVRRRVRRGADRITDVPYLVAPSDDPGRAADARTASRLIDRLPPPQREVVLLRHFADCTFAAIGTITGVPTFTASSRYRLAIAQLRRLLEDDHGSTD
jgi:RNA polymerase sigma-70 factor (ECF subfamily)